MNEMVAAHHQRDGGPSQLAPSSAQPTGSMTLQHEGPQVASAAPAKYIPRWKRDPNSAKPEPYRVPGGGGSRMSGKLQPGEYHAAQISEKLNAPLAHSFLVEYERLPSDLSTSLNNEDRNSVQDDLTRSPMVVPSERKQVLRAILNYPGANPPSTESGVQVIWTRNNIEIIQANINSALPFFTCTNQSDVSNRNRIFKYDGQYRIESAEIASKEQVLDFVRSREQSKTEKTAEVWRNKLNSTWLKVTLRRCSEQDQSGNPMDN